VSGRSDRADSEWLRAGAECAVAGQFLSPLSGPELRGLRRARNSLVRGACAWLGVPKDANIILRSVDRDTPGIPGRTMIPTVMDGKKIRQHWRCRRGSDCGATGSPERGGGTVSAGCHQLLVEQWMSLLCALGEEAANVFSEIDQRIQDIQSVTKLIRSVPGVDRTIACALIGEKGPGMSRFHHSLHLACSAGQSPPVNQQSAGHEQTVSHA
jgi:hypothetical protein